MHKNFITQEKIISGMIVLVSLLVMFCVIFYSIHNVDETPVEDTGTMPDIVGYSFEEVKEVYGGRFTLSVTGEEYSDKFSEGAILSQSIPSGEEYTVGETVEVTLSLGAEKAVTSAPEEAVTTVPEVTETSVSEETEIPEETEVTTVQSEEFTEPFEIPDAEFENFDPDDELELVPLGFEIGEQENGSDTEIYNRLYDLLRSKGVDAGYIYYEPETGRSLEYNADERFSSGSIIKAIYARSILDGSVDLDEQYEMTEDMLNSPYELVNGQPVGTFFTVRELIEAALVQSDNTAYKMLYNYVGYENFNRYAAGLGLPQKMTDDNFWFRLTTRETAVYFKDIYEFCRTDPNGALMTECLTNADYREMFASALPERTVAEKYGYLPQEDFYTLGDAAIISGNGDYILIVYRRNTGTVNTEFFRDAAILTDELQAELMLNA